MMLLPVPLAPERVSGFEYLGWRHMPGIDPNGVEYSPTPNFPARLEFSLEGVR